MNFRSISNHQRGKEPRPQSPLNLNNGKEVCLTSHPSVEEPYEGKLSRTVLKTSGGGNKPAEFNLGRVSR